MLLIILNFPRKIIYTMHMLRPQLNTNKIFCNSQYLLEIKLSNARSVFPIIRFTSISCLIPSPKQILRIILDSLVKSVPLIYCLEINSMKILKLTLISIIVISDIKTIKVLKSAYFQRKNTPLRTRMI